MDTKEDNYYIFFLGIILGLFSFRNEPHMIKILIILKAFVLLIQKWENKTNFEIQFL